MEQILVSMSNIDAIVSRLSESNITVFINKLNTIVSDSTVDCDGKYIYIYPLGEKSISEDVTGITIHLDNIDKQYRVIDETVDVFNIANVVKIELKHMIDD